MGTRWEELNLPGTLELVYDSKKDKTKENVNDRRVLKFDGAEAEVENPWDYSYWGET